MSGRVLVTRPQPGAARTALRLSEAGFTPLVLPLTEIVPLHVEAPTPPVAGAVVVTSANALRHLPRAWLTGLTRTTLFAVGAETGAAARRLGFADVVEGGGNARELAAVVAARHGSAGDILYLCGRVRLSDFEQALRGHGIVVRSVETYDTRSTVPAPGETLVQFGREPVAAVLLYSQVAALSYMELLAQPGMKDVVAMANHICMSGRVASGLAGLDPLHVTIAVDPTEDAMLAALTERTKDEPRPRLFSA